MLIVEDEKDIVELLRYNLEREGYEVDAAYTGTEALERVSERLPDMIILDIMLPEMDGLDVCRKLKESPLTRNIPIIMLTAKGEDADIVAGLELGADDYITKPFSIRVLLARVKAVLRRKGIAPRTKDDVIKIHDITVVPERGEVFVGKRRIELTATELRILQLLASHPGRIFTRDQIIVGAHGEDYAVTDRVVDVHIANLRKKLGDAGRWIKTVRGVGYKMEE